MTKKFQPHQLPLGLCLVTNGYAHHVPSLDTIRNQHLRLFVGGQEGEMSWPSPERPSPLDGFGEQPFERIGSVAHQSPVFTRLLQKPEDPLLL